MQLAVLDTAQIIEDRDVPFYCLDALKEKKQNHWSITVNANWRLTLEFKEGNAHILNYENYP